VLYILLYFSIGKASGDFTKVGIKSTSDVGSELAILFKKLEYEDIAESLNYLIKNRQ